jgi:hypothetical protein
MARSDNSEHLQRWREQQAADAAERVAEVLATARRQGAGVSFARVAREARVSRSWLYQSSFAPEIRELRSDPDLPARARESASDASLRARLEDALDDNRRLRSEVADLRRQLEVALGERRLQQT